VRVAVITISDRASSGVYEDLCGPEIERLIREHYPHCELKRDIVADEKSEIESVLKKYWGVDYIITTGGTGISPRDVTPEVTKEFCDRSLPGIAETLRRESYKETPFAVFSRGYAGIKGNTIVVNFPGSLKAVRLCTGILAPVMEHGIKMIRGEHH